MNNSKLAIDSISLTIEEPKNITPELREEEGKLLRIIEAIEGVETSKDWSTLKTYIFDGLVESLEGNLTREAKKDNPDTLLLNRLAGQLKWAEKFADLKKLKDAFRVQLTGVRKQLHGQTEKTA